MREPSLLDRPEIMLLRPFVPLPATRREGATGRDGDASSPSPPGFEAPARFPPRIGPRSSTAPRPRAARLKARPGAARAFSRDLPPRATRIVNATTGTAARRTTMRWSQVMEAESPRKHGSARQALRNAACDTAAA